MPLKQAILPYLRYVSPEACGGINTVVVHPDGLYGYSTDAQRIPCGPAKHWFGLQGANIVFIGAGAVTKLLADDAAERGAQSIVIVNRTLEKAQKIARQISAVSDRLANIGCYLKIATY